MTTEGVIQFEAHHEQTALDGAARDAVGALLGWRTILRDTGLLGQQPDRYDGLGYGNISHRFGARSSMRGRRSFVVSGTQTSGLERVDAGHFAEVRSWDRQRFVVTSRGPLLPSSESATHAAVYDQAPHIQAVLHVHSPEIWEAGRRLGLPATGADVAYGTPAMVAATDQLFAESTVWEIGLWVMRGHEDGVVAFGRTVDEAGTRLLRTLAAARSRRA